MTGIPAGEPTDLDRVVTEAETTTNTEKKEVEPNEVISKLVIDVATVIDRNPPLSQINESVHAYATRIYNNIDLLLRTAIQEHPEKLLPKGSVFDTKSAGAPDQDLDAVVANYVQAENDPDIQAAMDLGKAIHDVAVEMSQAYTAIPQSEYETPREFGEAARNSLRRKADEILHRYPKPQTASEFKD